MRHLATKKQQYWATILEQAEQSGESLADYAQAHNLAPQSLYRWRWKLKQSIDNETKETPQRFTQIVTPPSASTAMSIELNGVRLRFDSLPQVQWVSELINAQSTES